MSLINIASPTSLPGETAIASIANLIQTLADGQTPEEKAALWQRFLDITAPWQNVMVLISSDAATFVTKVFHIIPVVPPAAPASAPTNPPAK